MFHGCFCSTKNTKAHIAFGIGFWVCCFCLGKIEFLPEFSWFPLPSHPVALSFPVFPLTSWRSPTNCHQFLSFSPSAHRYPIRICLSCFLFVTVPSSDFRWPLPSLLLFCSFPLSSVSMRCTTNSVPFLKHFGCAVEASWLKGYQMTALWISIFHLKVD